MSGGGRLHLIHSIVRLHVGQFTRCHPCVFHVEHSHHVVARKQPSTPDCLHGVSGYGVTTLLPTHAIASTAVQTVCVKAIRSVLFLWAKVLTKNLPVTLLQKSTVVSKRILFSLVVYVNGQFTRLDTYTQAIYTASISV